MGNKMIHSAAGIMSHGNELASGSCDASVMIKHKLCFGLGIHDVTQDVFVHCATCCLYNPMSS